MGIPLAVALLTILFHNHNHKTDPTASILSARASYKTKPCTSLNKHPATFGIIKKTGIPSINSWIFGPHVYGNLPQVGMNELTEIHLSPDLEELIDLDDMFTTVKTTLQLWELSKNLHALSNHSPLLNQKMIPFMSSVTCLFEPVNKTPSTTEQHQKGLLDMVESWGFQLHPVEGDGDFFSCHCLCHMLSASRYSKEETTPFGKSWNSQQHGHWKYCDENQATGCR